MPRISQIALISILRIGVIQCNPWRFYFGRRKTAIDFMIKGAFLGLHKISFSGNLAQTT